MKTITALLIAATALLPGCTNPDRSDLEAVPLTAYQVGRGDTLWDLAAACPDTIDRRVWIQWIREQNGFDAGYELTHGQTIRTCPTP